MFWLAGTGGAVADTCAGSRGPGGGFVAVVGGGMEYSFLVPQYPGDFYYVGISYTPLSVSPYSLFCYLFLCVRLASCPFVC